MRSTHRKDQGTHTSSPTDQVEGHHCRPADAVTRIRRCGSTTDPEVVLNCLLLGPSRRCDCFQTAFSQAHPQSERVISCRQLLGPRKVSTEQGTVAHAVGVRVAVCRAILKHNSPARSNGYRAARWHSVEFEPSGLARTIIARHPVEICGASREAEWWLARGSRFCRRSSIDAS